MPGRFKHLPAELKWPFRGIRPFGPYRLTCGDRVSIRRLRDWVASSDGLRGDFELITIEVKKSSGQFLTSAGQAAAYGVYADSAYLCCPQGDKSFDEDNIDIASHLGIGLIEIGKHQEGDGARIAIFSTPVPIAVS